MKDKKLAADIYHTSHLTGKFKLRSGVESSEYFDKYRFESRPSLLKKIVEQMKSLIPAGTEFLAGLEMGGIPVVTALSLETGIPAVFVRKKAKDYGTCQLAEGDNINGRNVLIIEDVVTSGGQILLSAKDLRDRGAIISTVLCVIDRQAGGTQKLKEANLLLRPLFTMDELKDASNLPVQNS